ncbi:carbohydrate ABC transporter permease [Gordonia rhizosphera]|uniref:Putative ABC transporter permease protein n=1 Tax=Gordonia rhizosphera NBRC 16068 TaxID=1108045 RepID=K6WX40_9ACTN|nr:carbohydrate ABC transporter permease [Gordonia rhizosphera]GAB91129.1 putative ABC transporter permease protein [Gordonia rhizosphera NBRC 16068]
MATLTVSPVAAGRAARKRRTARFTSLRSNLGLVLVVVWGLAPVYWMVVSAFRDPAYIFDTTPWPTHVTFSNFTGVFSTASGNHFARAMINSVIIGAATTVIALIAGVFTAYALARMDFRGKNVVMGAILAASMFPGVALLTPLFQLFTNVGWYGTYPALIIPDISFVLPLTIYTLTTFFRELPWELEEAARLDGASRLRAFRTVLLPLAAPGMVTTAILAFIAAWNEFLIASQLADEKTQPATVAIASFAGSQPHEDPFGSIMAAGTIVTVPLILMVLLLQRRIVAGLTAGGVK